MRATILSIGDELTLGQNLDTNTRWLAEQLAAMGVETVEHRTVADVREAIAAAIDELAGRSDVLVVTGGLGPTDDDVTRESLGDVVDPGTALVIDDDARRRLEAWFRRRPGGMPAGNLRQATRPASARMLPNPQGTAPGLAAEHRGCDVYVLPGPPREMQPMFLEAVAPGISGDGSVIETVCVHEFGLGESEAAARLGNLTARDRTPLVGTTASGGVVTARIRARGAREAVAPAVVADAARVEEAWYPYAFGRDGVTPADATGAMLTERGATLATAESCTGGWLGKRIVDVAGASGFYLGGWVTYADAMKRDQLGVPAELLATHGAVSEPVARAMAAGAARRAGADWGIGITGIAGPAGGTDAKPVGTVFIGVHEAGGGAAGRERVRRFRFPAERVVVRERSVLAAIQMLRLMLLGEDDAPLLFQDDVEIAVP